MEYLDRVKEAISDRGDSIDLNDEDLILIQEAEFLDEDPNDVARFLTSLED